MFLDPVGSGKLVVLSSDALRESMFGDRRDQTHNAEVFATLHAMASAHLSAGDHVVIDATHLRRKDRLESVALAQGILADDFYATHKDLPRKEYALKAKELPSLVCHTAFALLKQERSSFVTICNQLEKLTTSQTKIDDFALRHPTFPRWTYTATTE